MWYVYIPSCLAAAITFFDSATWAFAALNVYYIVMGFVGIFNWRKDAASAEEHKGFIILNKMSPRILKISIAIAVIGIPALYFILGALDDPNPFLDAFTTVLSIIVYVFALFYEILVISKSAPEVDLVRTVIKILLGTMSAGTLFISSYYGKLSLTRQTSDHIIMANFYDRALEKLKKYGQTEDLLADIVRAELGENSNWYSYRIEDNPGFDLDIG